MIPVYIGWDPRDNLAWDVCARSLLEHSSVPLHIIALKESMVRRKGVYWRSYHVESDGQMWDGRDGKPFSTQFSFTRFAVPILENYDSDLAIFMDADMLWRADIAEMLEHVGEKALYCVQHDYTPTESTKMDGVLQTRYRRKNWSSLMVFRPYLNRGLTKYVLNNSTGSMLHGMLWQPDEEIGSLPEEWNWLCGWSPPELDPKVVHFTRGTPDMPGHENEPYADEWRRYAAQTAIREEIRYIPPKSAPEGVVSQVR